VDVEAPTTSTNAANVYQNDETAAAVLTGIYTNMSNSTFSSGGLVSLSLFPALSSDELTLYPGSTDVSYIGYFTNRLTNQNTLGTDFWNVFYQTIFVVNSAIEGLNSASGLTPSVKQQLFGEAKFMRAFCYFYLVDLYGDVPLALSTDFKKNGNLSRTPQAEVFQQIIADLKDAQYLLSNNYLSADLQNVTIERVRPTKWAATAMLARVYLYTGNYQEAEQQSSTVINNSLFSLVPLNSVFLKNSGEAIWQLQPVMNEYNTQDARLFVLPPSGPSHPSHPIYLSTALYNSFDSTDQRRAAWIDIDTANGALYYFPFKYKIWINGAPVTEYTMVLRLAEQYLIRAEARAQQNNIEGAQTDLNATRNRAGLPNTSASDKGSLLAAILHERQLELFTEWGHRWLDLKRTGNVDAVMTAYAPQKESTWSTNWKWYPISLQELQRDPYLVQNPGY